jgi:hypothetical protein
MLSVCLLWLLFFVGVKSQTCSPGYGPTESVYKIMFLHRAGVKQISYGGVGSNSNRGSVMSVLVGDETLMGKVDGTGTFARFNTPMSMVLVPGTKTFIVSDMINSQLRLVDSVSLSVTSFLDPIPYWGRPEYHNGVPPTASIAYPYALTFSESTGVLFVAVETMIKKVIYPNIAVSSFAISGYDPQNKFHNSLSFDGTFMILTNPEQGIVQRLDISSRLLSTIAGSGSFWSCSDGVGAGAVFTQPIYPVITKSGSYVYIADQFVGMTIGKIDLVTLEVSRVMGSCPAIASDFGHFFNGMVLSPDESYILYIDGGGAGALQRVDVSSGNVVTISPSSGIGYSFTYINAMMLIPGAAATCGLCGSGSYSLGNTICISCPAGHFCASVSSNPTACPPGSHVVLYCFTFVFYI